MLRILLIIKTLSDVENRNTETMGNEIQETRRMIIMSMTENCSIEIIQIDSQSFCIIEEPPIWTEIKKQFIQISARRLHPLQGGDELLKMLAYII